MYDGAADALMALVDCEGKGSQQAPGLGYLPALAAGWHLAPAWNQDNHRADWGDTLPRRVRAELLDGTRLDARIDEAETGVDLPAAAFDPPRCDDCRLVDANEARHLLTAR